MAGSVAIVGAGQIGFAAWRAFASRQWDVKILARSRPAWLSADDDCFQPYELDRDPAPIADCVIDTIAFDAEDIDRYDARSVGRLIAISSASVYCDAQGRTLDESSQAGFPEFPQPIVEEQSVTAPSDKTYSTRKVRMEQRAISRFANRATILRPCAIHGPWSRHPREWWFVKRILDGRTRIPLSLGGASRFQTSAAGMIGSFCEHAASQDLDGIFNLSDEDSPSVLEIGHVILARLESQAQLVPFDAEIPAPVGSTPWSALRPFTLSGQKAQAAGFKDALPYAAGVGLALDWLLEQSPEDWRRAFPQLAAYPSDLFDYASEDAMLEAA